MSEKISNLETVEISDHVIDRCTLFRKTVLHIKFSHLKKQNLILMWPNFIAQSFLTSNHNNNGRKSELQKLQQSKTKEHKYITFFSVHASLHNLA